MGDTLTIRGYLVFFFLLISLISLESNEAIGLPAANDVWAEITCISSRWKYFSEINSSTCFLLLPRAYRDTCRYRDKITSIGKTSALDGCKEQQQTAHTHKKKTLLLSATEIFRLFAITTWSSLFRLCPKEENHYKILSVLMIETFIR